MHTVIALYGYNNGGAIMTLVLPLGFFIVVMIALYFVFSRPHTVPGHQPITGARPVSPHPDAAPGIAAASGMPLATGTGATEPLADRGTPPVAAQAGQQAEADSAAPDAAGPDTGATDAGGTTGSDDAGPTGKPEETE